MTKLTVYYAHCMAIYNTPQEQRDIQTLEALGFKVVNPNSKETSESFKNLLSSGYNYADAFDLEFGEMVRACDVFAFKALPDARIPGGVAMELEVAQREKKLIIELPSGTRSRMMDGEETREYLRDIGER